MKHTIFSLLLIQMSFSIITIDNGRFCFTVSDNPGLSPRNSIEVLNSIDKKRIYTSSFFGILSIEKANVDFNEDGVEEVVFKLIGPDAASSCSFIFWLSGLNVLIQINAKTRDLDLVAENENVWPKKIIKAYEGTPPGTLYRYELSLLNTRGDRFPVYLSLISNHITIVNQKFVNEFNRLIVNNLSEINRIENESPVSDISFYEKNNTLPQLKSDTLMLYLSMGNTNGAMQHFNRFFRGFNFTNTLNAQKTNSFFHFYNMAGGFSSLSNFIIKNELK